MIIPLTKKQRDAMLVAAGLALTEYVDHKYGHEVWTKDGKNYVPPPRYEDLEREVYCPKLLQMFLARYNLIEVGDKGSDIETKSHGSMVYTVSEKKT